MGNTGTVKVDFAHNLLYLLIVEPTNGAIVKIAIPKNEPATYQTVIEALTLEGYLVEEFSFAGYARTHGQDT